MTSSENNDLKEAQREADTYEDEINLMDYFLVLWKRKWFIFLVTVLPALIVGITFFLSPRDYKVTYVYDDISDLNLNEKNYNVLIGRFYSEENLSKLMDKLREKGLEEYVRQLSSGKGVELGISPPFLDISRLNISDPNQIDKIKNMKTLLFNVTITSKLKDDIYKISLVIRDNIEAVMPLYTARGELSVCGREYNNKLASIESSRFDLELALKNNNEILAGLKKVSVGIPNDMRDNIVLQFNVGEQSQYLPLNYQMQAAESKRIALEGNIKASEEDYKYYKDLLDLNNRIFAELNNKLSSDYTVEQFRSFLMSLADSYEKPQLKDYLNSYIRKIENRISASKPITEKPQIHPIAKGTVRKSSIVFVVSFMISVFAAFLLEGLEKNRAQAS